MKQSVSSFSPQLGIDCTYIGLALDETISLSGCVTIYVLRGSVTVLGKVLNCSATYSPYYVTAANHMAPLEMRDCSGANLFAKNKASNNLVPPDYSDFPTVLFLVDCKPRISALFSNLYARGHVRPLDYEGYTGYRGLRIPAEWTRAAEDIRARISGAGRSSNAGKTTSNSGNVTNVVVLGSRGSGKSTFCRYLLNMLSHGTHVGGTSTGDFLLQFVDVDPGQPEFCPPGMMAETVVHDPAGVEKSDADAYVFTGPAYANLAGGAGRPADARSGCRMLFYGCLSPADDPPAYAACLAEILSPSPPPAAGAAAAVRVVNTHGWTRGLGLETLLRVVELAAAAAVSGSSAPSGAAPAVVVVNMDGPDSMLGHSLRARFADAALPKTEVFAEKREGQKDVADTPQEGASGPRALPAAAGVSGAVVELVALPALEPPPPQATQSFHPSKFADHARALGREDAEKTATAKSGDPKQTAVYRSSGLLPYSVADGYLPVLQPTLPALLNPSKRLLRDLALLAYFDRGLSWRAAWRGAQPEQRVLAAAAAAAAESGAAGAAESSERPPPRAGGLDGSLQAYADSIQGLPSREESEGEHMVAGRMQLALSALQVVPASRDWPALIGQVVGLGTLGVVLPAGAAAPANHKAVIGLAIVDFVDYKKGQAAFLIPGWARKTFRDVTTVFAGSMETPVALRQLMTEAHGYKVPFMVPASQVLPQVGTGSLPMRKRRNKRARYDVGGKT